MVSQQLQQASLPTPDPPPPDPPEESIRDRIIFVFNNVATSNTKEKAEELCSLLQESTLPWLAYYVVNKRVIVENSFHEVFDAVIDEVQKRFSTARQLVLEEVYRSIKVSQARLYDCFCFYHSCHSSSCLT